MLVCHIVPLDVPPITTILRNHILESLFDICLPSNSTLIDIYLLAYAIFIFFVKFVSVIKETLGDESTWNGGVRVIELFATHTDPLIFPQLLYLYDWIAFPKL